MSFSDIPCPPCLTLLATLSFAISTFQTYYDYDYSVYPKELKLQKHKKTIQINELYAVGILRTWNKNEITENMIREELGLPQRKVY